MFHSKKRWQLAGFPLALAFLWAGGCEAPAGPEEDAVGSRAHALTSAAVVGWGFNNLGQVAIPAGLSATAVSGGYYHSLALKGDGTVVGWGYNGDGQLNFPAGLGGVIAIAAGSYHGLALKGDGTVAGWGYNGFGQVNIPPGLSGVIAVAAGSNHSLALKGDGTVAGWGYNAFGQVNIPAGLSGVVAIAAGYYHSLALKGDGTVVGWGYDAFGQATIPTGLSGVVAIAGGGYHSLARKGDGTVVGWGYDAFGQATIPAGLGGVVAIAAGGHHSLALRGDGTVAGWGHNPFGQVTIPAGLGPLAAIAAGDSHSLAIEAPADAAAPAASPTQSPGPAGGWSTSDVTVTWNWSDAGSGLDAANCVVSSTSSGEGAIVLGATCRDNAGNTGSATYTVYVDKTAPAISCAAPDGQWHAADVGLACTAADATSGLQSAADASFTLSTSVPAGTETASAATGSRGVADVAGNLTTAGPIAGNRVDKKAPAISLTAPAAATYTLGQAVAASYACSDGGSGVASCTGTAPSGGAIDTAAVGPRTFTVNAADHVGNAASAAVSYAVVYAYSGFFLPVNAPPTANLVKAGIPFPVVFSLGGDHGLDILAPGYPVSQHVACDGGAPINDIEETDTIWNIGLHYSAWTNTYIYVWKTRREWAGTCRQLTVRLADGTDHVALFRFR